MKNQEKFKETGAQIRTLVASIFIIFLIAATFLVYLLVDPTFSAFSTDNDAKEYTTVPEVADEDYDKIENGVHVRTGFVDGEGLMLVVNNCTNCHSAKLVTQNRMSAERWTATIRWMQETQNLWDLGKNEEPIVTYLATYYAPIGKGRRENLTTIEWYDLEE